MDGWLVGLFTLLGVFVGGLFTFLGLREQLNQQSKLDFQRWKRQVRSEPLLKLRNELSIMAAKLAKLAADAQRTHTRFGGTLEEANDILKKSISEYNEYIESGGFETILFKQFETDLVYRVEEILTDYRQAFYEHVNYQLMKADDMKHAFDVFKKNQEKITIVQELINKKLEQL